MQTIHPPPWPWRMPTGRSLGFAARLSLAMSLLLGTACAVQTLLVSHHAVGQARTQLASAGRGLAAYVAEQARPAMEAGDVAALRQLAERVAAQHDVQYCRLFDASGLVLAASGPAAGGGLSGGDGDTPVVVGGDRWAFVAPIAGTTSGLAAGTAEVALSTASLAALRRRIAWTAAAFALLVILAAVVVAVWLGRVITAPLATLAHAADAIAAGELDTTVAVPGRDEIGMLATSFNAMAHSLAQSRAALVAKVRELEHVSHLKSEFVATVSHELRTPLNVMLGYVEMLREGAEGALTPGQQRLLESVERYARQQLGLVTNVLDFSRLSSGQVTCRVERFDLAVLLDEIVAPYAARVGDGRVRPRVDVAPDVRALVTDRTKVEEIVSNLVSNAVKFTPGGAVTVSARAAAGGDRVVVEVCDTGVGIDPEDLPHVFDPFYQVGYSGTRSTGGVGLGLSIVRQLVVILGGEVAITSTPGTGTVVRVEIPRQLGDGVDPLEEALDDVVRNTRVVAVPDRTLGVAKGATRPR